MRTILVVCVGNICRSPLAEHLLRAQLPDMTIWSAGLAAPVGKPPDPLAQEIAAEHGLDLSGHQARQLSGWMCRQADLILVMEVSHKHQLEYLYPSAHGKIRCLGELGDDRLIEVTDPYRLPRPAFENAYSAIERGVSYWTRQIRLVA